MVSIKLIIAGIALAVIIIAGGIVFFLIRGDKDNFSSITIPKEEITEGTYVTLNENTSIKFNINEEDHQMKINLLNENSVNVTIQSGIISAVINVGETKRFDLNNDTIFDLGVVLHNITNGEVNLYIKKISEQCVENWNCSEWTNCSNGNQIRVCNEINECGTEGEKPIETQECVVIPTCSELGGVICETTEVCNGNITTNSSEERCCLGNCEIKPIEVLACDDIDCLISASNTCNLANLTYEVSSSNSSWTQDATYYFKIRGLEGEKCKLYQEILDVTGNFTSSYRTTLLAVPYTEEQINQMAEEIESSMAGRTGICRFSTYSLNEYLTDVKETDYILTEDDIVSYECTGSLYQI